MDRYYLEDIHYTTTLPIGVDGYYDHEEDRIYMRADLPPAREVSVRAHERIHKYFRHQPTNNLPEHHAREIKVESMAARDLIPFPALLQAVTAHTSADAMARTLGVDAGMIFARVLDLTDLEQTILNMCGFQCLTNNQARMN